MVIIFFDILLMRLFSQSNQQDHKRLLIPGKVKYHVKPIVKVWPKYLFEVLVVRHFDTCNGVGPTYRSGGYVYLYL